MVATTHGSLIVRLATVAVVFCAFCRGGGVISVVAPPLVTSLESRGERRGNAKKASTSVDLWWHATLEGRFATPPKLASEQEFELNDYLFNQQGYNPLIRPVANISDALRVDLGLCMIKLIHIDERRQVMKSNVWLPMVWRDYQLTWDPGKYGGLRVIRVPHSRVWKPDIVLFNNADGNYEVVWQPNLLVHHDGSILWMPPAVYESSCAIDVEYFPFDEQECEMKFGSWAFDASRISMGFYSRLEFVDLSNYWRSGTWDLVDVPAKIVNTSDGGVDNTYIVYTIKLRRKTLFYTVNLIVPCVMLSFLSIFVFYLPSDAGEKVTLAISIVVALVVFLILVSKILPPTSTTVPLISRYLIFTFVSDVFAVFLAVLVVNWNYRSSRMHTMAPWVRVVFLRLLPRLLLMNPLHRVEDAVEMDEVPPACRSETRECLENEDAFIQEFPEGASLDLISSLSTDSEERSASRSPTHQWSGNVYENLKAQCLSPSESLTSESCSSSETTPSQKTTVAMRIRRLKQSPYRLGVGRPRTAGQSGESVEMTSSTPSEDDSSLSFGIVEALRAVDYVADRLDEKQRNRVVVQEWKYAASVIDRLVLAVFTIISVLVALTLLTNAPSLLAPIDQDAVINKYSVIKRN